MTAARRATLAWSLVATTVALAVLQVSILALSDTPLISSEFSDDGFPVITTAAVVASVVGALIVSRHPRHRIGWLFLIGQVATMVGLVCQSYGYVALSEGWGPRLPAQVAIWVSILAGGILGLSLMALLLLLAPDGRLLSRRWRWAVGVTMSGLVLHDAAVATLSPTRMNAEASVEGATGAIGLLALVGGFAVVCGLVAGAVSLGIRMRRATGDERAQLRWIGSAALLLAASVPVAVVVDLVFGVPTWAASLPMMLGYLAVPVFTGVAILRFRLYDIDVLINRSLVLAMLTTVVAVAYVGVVVALGHLADPAHGAGGEVWTSVLATVVVALGFQPMRERVDGLADRLVYGDRAAPYEALASFSEELRAGVAAADLLPRIAEITGRTIGARQVTVWVHPSGAAPTSAEWKGASGPSDGGTAYPVVADGQTLGGLTISMARGRGLRRSERALVSDFAEQLTPAFSALHLECELAAQVDALAVMNRALERSRRRLLSAQSAERARFEAAISREVLPHLRPLPAALRDLAHEAADRGWPGEEVDRLMQRASAALDALRILTRGVFPAQLEHRGLVPTLTTHLGSSGHELSVATGLTDRRFPSPVESAAYFCVVETLGALVGEARVAVSDVEGHLVLSVTGRPRPSFEVDTDHVVDRGESVGGAVLRERCGDRASVTVRLPLSSDPLAEPDGAQLVGAER